MLNRKTQFPNITTLLLLLYNMFEMIKLLKWEQLLVGSGRRRDVFIEEHYEGTWW